MAATTPKRRANGLWRPDAPLAGTDVLVVEVEELVAVLGVLEVARVLDALVEDVLADEAVDEAAEESVEEEPVDDAVADEAVPVVVPVEAADEVVAAAVEPPVTLN